MKQRKLVFIMSILALSGCTTNSGKNLIGNAIGNAVDTKVGYDQNQCFRVQTHCVEGHYEEWLTSDGVKGCSCKAL